MLYYPDRDSRDRFQSHKDLYATTLQTQTTNLTMVFLPLEICHLRWPLELGHQDFTRNCHHQIKDRHHQVQRMLRSMVLSYHIAWADTPDRVTCRLVRNSPLK
jgi:hypothetical protein